MDDIFSGCGGLVIGFLAFAFLMTGVLWLVTSFWWAFLLIGLAAATWWLIYRHPGVKAKRQMKVAVRRGTQKRQQIRQTAERAKAEMDRIAREWKGD